MESSISEIIKTAIELDKSLIEKYLFEQQNKSSDSPQVFYGKLKSKINEINKEKPSPIKWLFHEELGGWFEDMGLINRNIEREGILTGTAPGRFLKHLEELYSKFVLLSEKINQLFDDHTLESPATTSYGTLQPIQGQKLVNKFNTLPIEVVRKIFSPLVEQKNADNQYWMTRSNFEIFLRRSFGKENLQKPKINIGKRGKGCIIKLFHKFYSKCQEHWEIESRHVQPFIDLLKEAFETDDFDNLRKGNFNQRAKYDWNY